MRQLVNKGELEKFFANICSLMKRDEGSSQLPDLKHLERFFLSIGSRLAKQQQLDRKEATLFNVFDLIQPDENKLSDILRDLLDPNGNHGQGDLFLDLFFKQLGIPRDTKLMKGATVHREVLTHGISNILRRMDVLIEAGMLKVAIENKVESRDQPQQVEDYLEHLRYCTRVPPARSILIYLTPDGRRPEYVSPEVFDQEVDDKRLCRWSYGRDLQAWLEDCQSQCEAPRIRDFLSDFVRYIELELKRETENEQEEEPHEH
jgi:hypothetical protein